MATKAPPAPSVDRNALGTITIHDSVVAKIAARAAWEVPDVGAAAPRLVGKSLTAAHLLGGRSTTLADLPRASARVDGGVVVVELSISVRWPSSIPAVTRAVRRRVLERIVVLTGLRVAEVTIEVADLVTDVAPQPRVH
ncbi:MAG TPA: Asp23/Gls24 family envelope stress response protein [Mycobacterium sp.]|nr:Asp23/Gls24 family envelope stress response protein [Mycobacterium sp.]